MKMTWKKASLAEMYSHKMIAFLSPEDRRHKYIIYHTLELQASKHRGVLRYSETRAFTHEELAKMCLTDIDSLEKALEECKDFELIMEEEAVILKGDLVVTDMVLLEICSKEEMILLLMQEEI